MSPFKHPPHLIPSPEQDIIYRGWVLKKRRKKMQGFARRYFVLHQSGILSYSIDPKRPTRDQIFLPQAAISTAAGRRDIHIDSSNATFHIKCLSMEDFSAWMTAFRHKDHHKDAGSVFGIFKKCTCPQVHSDVALIQLYTAGANHHDNISSYMNSDFLPHSPLQRVYEVLGSLKSQHAALLKSLQPLHLSDTTPTTARGSPLPSTAEVVEEPTSYSRLSTPLTRLSQRASCATSLSDGTPIEWFDAQDGGEEFFLEDMTPEEERNGPVLQSDSSLQDSDSSEDTHEEEIMTPQQSGEMDPSIKAREVVRRTHLPSGPVGDEGSLFSMLKKNVGKDLSAIAFPVSFNEPLTLLQRSAEEVEYCDLLRQAVEATNPVDRMCYVAAYAISGYAHTQHRSSRKGFNPMLGETFEDVRMKFVAEKVQHNPVVIAYHAEGDGWELYATTAGKTKFWGKSLEIIPLGTTYLKIQGDEFEWNKPSSFMRNIMVGTKYLEHCGKMDIKNTVDGSSCVIDFKQSGYWGSSNEISGTVLSSTGTVLARIEGKWDEQIAQALDSSHLRVLWRITPFPKQSPEYYGFTLFGMTLNEITSDLEGRLPPSDSRFRPDVRALEEGDIDKAESEKTRVEELQRERRRRGADRKPRWFKQVGDEWRYIGGYWESRARGWKDSPVEPLW
ncbi:hypothetical protein SERLA73DRAFT_113704 [Serpula lacrymans var. lacrymans S7.3]|uniref:PH domain-containing protein n=2 Tax=Serpula lacrymans var. lacrymans TaxID=341189 RepID=F8Q8U7_SERL3|nr:uncharacterized protein SERLADRAFT_363401 [Serpula lacrymans var. lacrymans S7.9]EGN95002.1 hypothetical protein SERLA73DRAFT_113704 [Serpula lacrymans var. lacrymans S7.3]EGO20498.1 hypothetical protein SERLADRAFT_363401 [Serpula lacrymans var. lacrymans S7.9]